jgi:CRISPR-associated protein Cas2
MRRNRGSNRQTTCYVIAYDIPDDKRRTKIHKLLLGFGAWTQYSLFECFLNRRDLAVLHTRLAEHVMATEDSVRFYPLCADCLSKVGVITFFRVRRFSGRPRAQRKLQELMESSLDAPLTLTLERQAETLPMWKCNVWA